MHYYKFNIGDYRKDTGHLSTLEHGIYRQLIDWYYLDEKPIPKETQVVMRRLRLGTDEVHLLENVLTDFFNLTDFGYVHNRIAAELSDYQAQFSKNRVNGKLGGRPKKTQVVISGNPDETQAEPKITLTNNHKPLTNNHIKNISAKKIDFFAGIPEQLILDYKEVRKAKRAPAVNQTVFNGLKREADKAKITIEQALTVCVERNWVGFKADWYQNSLVQSRQAEDLSWRNDEAQIMKIANELKVHTQGKSRFEILAKIDEKKRIRV